MRRPWIAALVLAATAASVLGAQAFAPADEEDLAAQLAELNTTLMEIRDVLSQQLESTSLDLMLKRSELVSADVARLETQLRDAEGQRASVAEDELRIQTQMEEVEARLRSADAPAEEMDIYSRQMEFELEAARRRIRDLDGEIQDLQNRLTAKQRDLQSWQDMVDRRLGGV